MLTDFGRYLRKIRLDCSEILKDMADKLEVTSSYLSAVETGKRNIPDHWPDTIAQLYNLPELSISELKAAAEKATTVIKFDIRNLQEGRRETAILFAREFENIDDETISQIRSLLKKDVNKGGI